MRHDRTLSDHSAAVNRVQRALSLQHQVRNDRLSGRAIASARRKIIAADLQALPVSAGVAASYLHSIDGYTIEDMPAPTTVVRWMTEAIAVRWGGISLDEAMAKVGIGAGRARNLLFRGDPITWPEWVVLWDAAIGPSAHTMDGPPR